MQTALAYGLLLKRMGICPGHVHIGKNFRLCNQIHTDHRGLVVPTGRNEGSDIWRCAVILRKLALGYSRFLHYFP